MKPVVQRKLRARARVTNRPAELPNVDLRSLVARRFTDITSQLIIDLGGEGRISEAKLQLVRRFAATAAMAENMEAAFARDEAINIAEHAALTSALCRLASRIGIDRNAKNVTPALRDYLEHKTKRNGRIIEHDEDA